MTTIAVSEFEIAWDSQVTKGNVKASVAVDKVVVVDNKIYACCGDADCCEALPKWHAAGAKTKKIPEGDWEMLVISERGIKHYTDSMPTGMTSPVPTAIGSGGDFALTALRMGKSAAEAVSVAIGMDIFSGPPVKVLRFDDVFKAAKRKRAVKRKRAGSPAKKTGTLTKRKKAA